MFLHAKKALFKSKTHEATHHVFFESQILYATHNFSIPCYFKVNAKSHGRRSNVIFDIWEARSYPQLLDF